MASNCTCVVVYIDTECSAFDTPTYCSTLILSRAYRPQRGRGHVTAIQFCIHSKIQTREWFVTNYSNICMDYIIHTEDFTIFSLDMNFVRRILGGYTIDISVVHQCHNTND